MARLSDHDQRDAEHRARMEVRLAFARYIRRMDDKAKAYITEAISQANKETGGNVDGVTIGAAAAQRVIAEFLGAGKPQSAIDIAADCATGDVASDKAETK